MNSKSLTVKSEDLAKNSESKDTLRKALIKRQLAQLLGRNDDQIDESIALGDLIADSFILIDIVIQLQEKFGITLYQKDLREVNTVDDLLVLLEKRMTET
jgi:acyl carrier protein